MASDSATSRPGPVPPTRVFVLPDPAGVLRARFQPAPAVGGPPGFSEYVFAVDEQDRLIPAPPGTAWPSWRTAFPDLPTTSAGEVPRQLAWRSAQEAVFVSIAASSPLAAAAPRQALDRAAGRLLAAGLSARIGFELEFQLTDPLRPGTARAYGMDTSPVERAFFERLVPALIGSGIGVESWSREGGAGQWELALEHATPRDAADRAVLARLAVQEVAAELGLAADFAPTLGGEFGNGLHAHVSFSDAAGGNPLRPGPEGAPTSAGTHALAGVVTLLAEATALVAPSVRAFARFAPHSAAGTSATWAPESRCVGVRSLDREEDTRIELRVPSGDADPYVVVATVLASAAHGVAAGVRLPAPIPADAYEAIPDGSALPGSLGEAAERLERSGPLRSLLGDGFVDHQVTLARWRAANS